MQFGVMSVGFSFQQVSLFVEITNGAVIFCYTNKNKNFLNNC